MSKKKLAKILDTAVAVIGIALIAWVALSILEIGFASALEPREFSALNFIELVFGVCDNGN